MFYFLMLMLGCLYDFTETEFVDFDVFHYLAHDGTEVYSYLIKHL